MNAGLSKSQAKHLFKNKDEIKQLLDTKQIFLDFATNNAGKMPDNLVNFLKGSEMHNSQLFSKEFTNAARAYFSTSIDPLFKKINPANMMEKELKKLIKKADKMDVKINDLKVLKELYRNKKLGNRQNENAHTHSLKGNIKQ